MQDLEWNETKTGYVLTSNNMDFVIGNQYLLLKLLGINYFP